jgi:hypothetical protein
MVLDQRREGRPLNGGEEKEGEGCANKRQFIELIFFLSYTIEALTRKLSGAF